MTKQASENKRWNLFARELEDLLRMRGRDLNDLINNAEFPQLHREQVRRLKQSLINPKFHLLSPEALEHVSTAFHFTGEEELRLRAAILATAVEETLMNRIDPENALRAGEEVFPILLKALKKHLKQQRGLAATRRIFMTEEELTPTIDALDPILERFDRAMLALHLSRQGNIPIEQQEQAITAHDRFTRVLAELDDLCVADPMMAKTDAWQVWHQEAKKGLASADEALERFQQS